MVTATEEAPASKQDSELREIKYEAPEVDTKEVLLLKEGTMQLVLQTMSISNLTEEIDMQSLVKTVTELEARDLVGEII